MTEPLTRDQLLARYVLRKQPPVMQPRKHKPSDAAAEAHVTRLCAGNPYA